QSENRLRGLARLFRRVGELHAARLHAAARQHLRLENDRAADLGGDGLGLLWCAGKPAAGNRNLLAGQNRPRLVLEEPHAATIPYASASSGSFFASISARLTIT